jgi:hypothetical protein
MKIAAFVFGALMLATPASAVTININTGVPGDFVGKDRNGNTIALGPACDYGAPSVCGAGLSYYEAIFNFNLPANYINAALNVTQYGADDRSIFQLNGVTLAGAGIFAPGNGFIQIAPGLTNVAYTYTLANNVASGPYNGPFQVGANTLRIIVNDTVSGIFNEVGPDSPRQTGMIFVGSITYDLRQGGGGDVSEPETLALLGAGLLGLAAVRRRKSA